MKWLTHGQSEGFANVKWLTHGQSEGFASVKWLTHGQSKGFASVKCLTHDQSEGFAHILPLKMLLRASVLTRKHHLRLHFHEKNKINQFTNQ
ncbi:MAG: hypothetical protein II200_09005 [Bacteroidaceae bacterium]|nr:hypothetical protein [Bacteroidaceae bacterium]